MKKIIELDEGSEEFKEIKKEWLKKVESMTLEKLPEFLKELSEDYEHDYGTICHAIACASLAAARAMNSSPQGDITGFQASAVMWEFIRGWTFKYNKTGLRIVDYDNFLYPQYETEFEKTISVSTWNLIQNEAQKNIERATEDIVGNNVYGHWESIVNGVVPFGYVVKDR